MLKKPPVAGKVVYVVSRLEAKPKAPPVVPEPAAPTPKPEMDQTATTAKLSKN